jgi:DNA-binding transcriptional ArsR family regulator
MKTNEVARIAALIGEPARTGMLLALMDGRAHTAHELAVAGRVTPATASRHLAQLVEARLLTVVRQGRHRYHRLASAQVARLLEDIMRLASEPPQPARRSVPGPRDERLRLARTCYDHLGGGLAVAIAERLVQEQAVILEEESAVVTDRAPAVLEGLGLKFAVLDAHATGKRPACRPCLDWTERRPHLAGRLGALLCSHCLSMGWLLQQPDSRALHLTPRGAAVLRDWLGTARWQALSAGGEAA